MHNVESNNLEMPQCQVIKSTVGKGYYNQIRTEQQSQYGMETSKNLS